MATTLRFLALLCALIFLLLCWTWTYWVALTGYLFGGVAWGMLNSADRLDLQLRVKRSIGGVWFAKAVRGLILFSVALSLVSLAVILAYN